MSVRARAIATTGVVWALLVGAATLTTIRRGGMKVIAGAQPDSALRFERQYDFTGLFSWITVLSATALMIIVLSCLLTIRSSRTTEVAYEVVPREQQRGEPATRPPRLDLTA
jgi:hypothetical protein